MSALVPVAVVAATAAAVGWRNFNAPGSRRSTGGGTVVFPTMRPRKGGTRTGGPRTGGPRTGGTSPLRLGLRYGIGLPGAGRSLAPLWARASSEAEPARWATRRDVRPLLVDAPRAGRLTLGTARRRLLAAERGHSVLVVGPTQSRKTSGFAVPAILEWQGPVVAASVKSDLAIHTLAWRRRRGRVWVYDPSASTGLEPASWSPLQSSRTWEGARRTAASLTEVARSSPGSLTDGDFWYATAAKLLAPLLLAAATSGGTMADVVRWVDLQEVEEVFDVLSAAGAQTAAAGDACGVGARRAPAKRGLHHGRNGGGGLRRPRGGR